MSTEIILTLILIIIFWLWKRNSRPENYPPGPIAFPIVGSIPLFGKDPLNTFQLWKKKYGDMFSMRLAGYNCIVINDYKLIKEAYNEFAFSGRPNLKPLLLLGGGKKRGLVPNEGESWSEQRRFALRHLRDFGFGKKSMEGVIHENITDLLASFKPDLEKPVSVDKRFAISILGSLWRITTGEMISYNDTVHRSVLDKFDHIISKVNIGGPLFFFPWVSDWFPKLSGWNNLAETVQEGRSLIMAQINKHKESFQEDNLRDFIDVHLAEIKSTTDPNSSFFEEEGIQQLIVVILNLFVAGSQPVANSLSWALLLIASRQDVLSKIQAEIEQVIGNSRLPSLDDKPKMKYTEAVTMEVFRISSLSPLGVFHNTMKAVEFNGYKIPEDTMIMTNLYGLHHDPELWDKAEDFKPERHLVYSAGGAELRKDNPPVIPFLVGKRQCLGEVLARAQFFLFLTSICQSYDFVPDPAAKNKKIQASPGIFRFPKDPFDLVFSERTIIES